MALSQLLVLLCLYIVWKPTQSTSYFSTNTHPSTPSPSCRSKLLAFVNRGSAVTSPSKAANPGDITKRRKEQQSRDIQTKRSFKESDAKDSSSSSSPSSPTIRTGSTKSASKSTTATASTTTAMEEGVTASTKPSQPTGRRRQQSTQVMRGRSTVKLTKNISQSTTSPTNAIYTTIPKVKLYRASKSANRSNRGSKSIKHDQDEEWEYFYQKLQQHTSNETNNKKNSATTTTSSSSSSGTTLDVREQSLLRNWCADQRKSYMKSLGVLDLGEKANWGTEFMTRERKERLDAAGFFWGQLVSPSSSSLTSTTLSSTSSSSTPSRTTTDDDYIFSEEYQAKVRLKYKDWIWNPLYDRLKTYYEKNGHTNVRMKRTDVLGTWCAKQRRIREDMPDRRKRKLDALGFDWDWNEYEG